MEQANSGDSEAAERFQRRLEQAHVTAADEMGQLFEAYRPYLLGIANEEIDSDLRGKAGGSDLVQQTFLEAGQAFAAFRGTSEGELVAWLRQILLNNVADLRRQYRTEGRDIQREVALDAVDAGDDFAGELPASCSSPSERVMAREEADAVEQALARLPEDYRLAIVLRHQQQRSFAEIGEALGRSAEAARKLWARAVVALQAEMPPSS